MFEQSGRSAFLLSRPGWAIVLATAVLLVIGLGSIFVTDTHYVAGHDGPRNAVKQVFAILVGGTVGLVLLAVGYPMMGRWAYALFAACVLILAVPVAAKFGQTTLGGLVTPRNGAYRWISLPGFQLQPSEPMKLAYVLALAWYLRHRSSYRRFSGLWIPVVFSAVPAALILLQPDLGMVLLLLPVLFSLLFMAGAKLSHLGIIALLGLAAAPLAWDRIHGYQRLRVTAVFLQSDSLREAVIRNPEAYKKFATRRQALEWSAGSGYQLVHANNAIGSGGLLGNGWGRGVYVENGLLPDRHNDFVIAVVAHQWGFAGCLLVLTCYGVIVVAGTVIASATAEPFGRLLAVGVVTLIASQVTINVGMALGMMPITGMTLPFVSYGGSSVLTNLTALAILVSVAQHRPYLLSGKPFEFAPKRERGMLVEKGHSGSGSRSPRAEPDRNRSRPVGHRSPTEGP